MPEITAEEFTRSVRPVTLANRDYAKIFGIGANKTATTSLEEIFHLYGFHVPNEVEQGLQTAKQTMLGNYKPLARFVEKYDAFQDFPFRARSIYVVVDALFPDSKFILTERDPDAWYDSLVRYHKQRFGIDEPTRLTEEEVATKFDYLYPGYMRDVFERNLLTYEGSTPRVRWDLIYDRDYYIDAYIKRNEEVRKYFHGRDCLLCIDLTCEPDTSRLCHFLNIPERFAITVPHLNRSA